MVKQVPFITFTMENFNPNHRIRFLALAEPTHFLFDLSSAVKDDSFYIAPLLAQPVTIQQADASGAILSAEGTPSQDIHLSFHETGAVNLHIADNSARVRSRFSGKAASGLVARLVFSSLGIFRSATLEEINSLGKRFTLIPVTGFWGSIPVCLDIYQVNMADPWIMPILGDIIQTDVCVQPKRKDSAYHFVIWQHSQTEPCAVNLTVYYSPL